MALSTYAELQTSIASWLQRADLTARIPDFITLAESQLSTDLDTYWQVARATCSTTADDQYITLPDDVLQIKGLLLTNGDTTKPLKLLSLTALSSTYTDGSAGLPVAYAQVGNQLKIGPIPDAIYTMELIYKQRIPALADNNTTNWLLTNFPNAYLWASLLAAQPFIINDPRLATFGQLYTQTINSANRTMYNTNVPDGGMRMRRV